MLRHCSVLVLLAALSSAGPITPNAGCTYRGRVYSNLDTIPHDNGCATQQCQFGQVVTFYEACGKDVDGNCHRINMMYVYKEDTYECKKVAVGSTFEYKNVVAYPAANRDCVEGTKTYKHLEKYIRPGGCLQIQCQNGIGAALYPGCEKTIDGKCHMVGELYTKGSTTYNCTTQDRNGETLFVNTPLSPPRNTRPCSKDGVNYNDLDVFRLPGKCQVFQCQDRVIKVLAQDCSFNKDNGKCYAVGEGWKFGDSSYQCVLNEQGKPQSIVASKGFKQCNRAENIYDHLDIQVRGGGCLKLQCQDGVTPPVEEACAPNIGGCKQLNSIWTQGSKTLICILKEPGMYRIEEVDEFGKIIEREVVTLPPPVFEETCPNLKGDIIFVWDASGSMSRSSFARQLLFSCDIANAFKLGPDNVQFGGVVFSTSAEKVFDLNTSHNITEVCKNIQSTPYIGSFTETQKAFDVILEEGMFLPDAGGRPDAPKIVIVITDGISTNRTITVAAAGQIKALGVQIISIGVGAESKLDREELGGIASRPENVFTISNYGAIFALRTLVAERACKAPTDPPITPEEATPPKCPNAVADILFILDSSSGVGSENYQTKLYLANTITSMFTVSPKAVQFGAVLVGTQPKIAFNLNTHSSNAAVTKAITGAEYLKGDRELDDAIDSVISQGLYTSAKGGRDKAARIAVILIDGPPTDWAKTLPIAKKLRNEGVRVITVGIGNIQMKKLTGLSGNTQYVFASPNYQLLGFTKALLYQRLCEATKLPRPEIEPPRCTDTETQPCDHFCNNTDNGFTCYCKTGYLVNKQDNSKCDDNNECTNTKLCQQICVNTVGSYTCQCEEGFAVSPDDPSDCVDTDECQSNPCQGSCTNTEGSYTCTCNEGYRVSPTDAAVCIDIDECKESSPCQQLCTNTDGSYTCACRPGYVVSPTDPTKCDDVDECRESSPCQQQCTNTDGGYTCSCKPGYVISPTDRTKCEDIDECKVSSPCQQLCTNTDGSYTCSCNPGYVVRPTDPTKCDDVDECKAGQPCEHICTNTEGSYTCSCRPHYGINAVDPSKCDSLDHCKIRNPCEQICDNDKDKYRCSCTPGYVVSPSDPTQCDDLDECTSEPCEQVCKNTVGSYTCSCAEGYIVNKDDPSRCTDLDECKVGQPCDQLCTNTEGSYECSCRPGYRVNPADPSKCDGIDECKESSPCQQLCTNTDGSYTCACRPGYVVNPTDPTKCDDVNECTASSPCQHICVNTVGSYTCSCNPGFGVSPTDPTKCDDLNECRETSPCQQICTNTVGSYTCSCESGFLVRPTDPTKCDDVDECKAGQPCEHICTNTEGSYTCSCRPHYGINAVDPSKCDSLDHCKIRNPCEQICDNDKNTYRCSCTPGYVISPSDPTQCDDLDECPSEPCEQVCKNTIGSYTCSCVEGYVVDKDDHTRCTDLDECKIGQPCDQLCTNTEGSYECSCRPGYRVNPADPSKCDDLDECPSEPCEQVCKNTIGSYTCSCVEGYIINRDDPSRCTETDECKNEPCEQICKNTPGGFNCSCVPGYVVNPLDITTCKDEDECLDQENPPCHHKCINTEGSYRCDCRKGYVPNHCDENTCRDIDECEQGLCESKCTNTRGGYFCS